MLSMLPARFKRFLGVLLGTAWLAWIFLPPRAAAPPGALAASMVCLNEFLPRACATRPNDAHVAASQTFIELYNGGAAAVDVGGWVLKVDSASYTIPGGTSLASGAYKAFSSSTTGLSFPAQGTVRLLDAGGASVDQKGYGSPLCNLSFGRYPNGGSQWYGNLMPSPGGPNTLATATALPAPTRTPTRVSTATPGVAPSATPGVAPSATPIISATRTPTRAAQTPTSPAGTASATSSLGTATPTGAALPCLSEFMPAPRWVDWDGDGTANYTDEWIELYNPSSEEIDLQGWQLDDRAGGGSRPYTFPAGSRLGAGTYGVCFQHQTGLALNNDGDDVRLLDPLGQEVDRFSYVLTEPDASYSRVGGCGGRWVRDQVPSPGQPNPTPPALYLPLIWKA
jgi:hypothetical protein